MKISIYDNVKVKLTDYGKELFYHRFDEINNNVGHVIVKPYYPNTDKDGYTTISLMELMEIYGKYVYVGGEKVFENYIEIVKMKK